MTMLTIMADGYCDPVSRRSNGSIVRVNLASSKSTLAPLEYQWICNLARCGRVQYCLCQRHVDEA